MGDPTGVPLGAGATCARLAVGILGAGFWHISHSYAKLELMKVHCEQAHSAMVATAC